MYIIGRETRRSFCEASAALIRSERWQAGMDAAEVAHVGLRIIPRKGAYVFCEVRHPVFRWGHIGHIAVLAVQG